MDAFAHTPDNRLFAVSIAGPTGAGKSAAALALADAFPAAVINADSRQVYRDFPIITAQPSQEEQSRCPHLLYGWLESDQALGAGAYARKAAAAITKVAQESRLPLLVGGTGLYFKALLEGIAPIPKVPQEIHRHWQKRCLDEGSPALHALLVRHDPVSAARIHPNDRQRVTRALEVWHTTGRSLTAWHASQDTKPPYAECRIGIALDLPELEPLLAKRIDVMIEQGALGEAKRALVLCPDPTAPGWTGIGCSEAYRYLTGELSIDECKALWLKNTRAYAKRQLTWFRADKRIVWFRPGDTDAVLRHVRAALQEHGRC